MTSGCLWLWLTVLARERKVSIRLVGLYAEPVIGMSRRAGRGVWTARIRDCHQFVTIGGGFRPFGARSSGSARRKMPGKFRTYRASSTPSTGLKILVSAVQSRPSPPVFLSH
jgi:hypothetical protein